MARIVACPQCGNPSLYAETNPFRPFCTERCRLIDLGAWAEGSYRIVGGEDGSMGDEGPDDDSPGIPTSA